MKTRFSRKKRGLAPSGVEGFTLFIALVVMGTLLLIVAGIVSLATRQALISASGRESQYAFYAADTGIECALYWDVHNPSGTSAFATSTGSTITCNNSGNMTVGGGGDSNPTSTFSFNLLPDLYCVTVTVNKKYVSGILRTTIESKGYNTCDLSNPRRVERAIRARY
ncbi:MAG: pilus assembly PilX N-terminal domain-containing protein [bacterium]|nr:pilus assembly PilX N-terminal domain-containing protein [bacterium]MDZ4205682.1 pilus assembly PilX N-terminal domain-containing protein [Patescibacteria group bacterium]